MTKLEQAARQALEALEAETHPDWDCNSYHPKIFHAIEALREALREALGRPKQDLDPAARNGWVPREVLFDNGEPVGHREPQVAAAGPEQVQTRERFESWAKAYSTLPLAKDSHGYADMTVEMLWHAWQAAKTNAPEGASEGESDANTRLGLAGNDSNCKHEFSVQPSSGILLCAHCGLSEVATRKHTAPQVVAVDQRPVAHLYCGGWFGGEIDEWEIDPVQYQCDKLNERFAALGKKAPIPLYTTPQPARQPLTDDEIYECERIAAIQHQRHKHSIRGQQLISADNPQWHFARAVERANGIVGKV